MKCGWINENRCVTGVFSYQFYCDCNDGGEREPVRSIL